MITIDARWLNTSGMGTYLRNILPGVIAAFPEKDFCLLGDISDLTTLDCVARSNIRLIETSAAMYSLSEQIEIPIKIPKETSLFWATHYNVPLLYRGKMLVMVHDLFHLAMPDLVGGLHKRLYATFMFRMVRRRAAAILTHSQFTKVELNRFTGVDRQSVYPIHLGVDDSWFNIKRGEPILEKPYLLYVGNVKPHKNLNSLVKAFGSLVNTIPHDLIIVGKKDGFITGDSLAILDGVKFRERIHFTGSVTDDMLKQYMAHADIFVFPSFYEGFGLPPLEAMAAGCPVIVSNAASLPEICGDAALYVDPNQPQDIVLNIKRLLGSKALREELKYKGGMRARQFTWKKCITKTCSVIDSLVMQ